MQETYSESRSSEWHKGLTCYQYRDDAWRDALPVEWIALCMDDISLARILQISPLSTYTDMLRHLNYAFFYMSDDKFERVIRAQSLYTTVLWEILERIRICIVLPCCITSKSKMQILVHIYRTETVSSIQTYRPENLQDADIVYQHIVTHDKWKLYMAFLLHGAPEHIHARALWLTVLMEDKSYLTRHVNLLRKHNAIKCMRILQYYLHKLTEWSRNQAQTATSNVYMKDALVPVENTVHNTYARISTSKRKAVHHDRPDATRRKY